MPTTKRRNRRDKLALDLKPKAFIGVDGCKAGWIAAKFYKTPRTVEISIWPAFKDLFDALNNQPAIAMIDMPIGLKEREKRACEGMARSLLKPLRHASIFPSPLRPMLSCKTYEEANAYGKKLGPGFGLTKQSWMITPKIREIDAVMTPEHQSHIGEGHPELAFWRLCGGAACPHPKRTEAGQKERLKILAKNGLRGINKLYADTRKEYGAKIAMDDIIDACALALTAEARFLGKAKRLSDDSRDARGLVTEIWG